MQVSMNGPCAGLQYGSSPLNSGRRPASSDRRPTFHLAPVAGWINDPNGPLLHNGTYHLFYQHVPHSSTWQWGLVWGHAKSQDLINWEHLPVALEPTPKGLDQHGCFSGCAVIDTDGRPYILYTGVIRKAPHEIEPGVSPQHESQMIAVACKQDDPDLRHWQKLPGSFLPHPPAEMDLTGWRDPFVLEKPSASSPWWYVMIGAGVRNKCGTALVYRSKDLTAGWQYFGVLCESPASNMWECPILAHLTNALPSTQSPGSHQQQPVGQQQRQVKRHMLSASPDYCINMIQYWLGDYAAGAFDLESADGPFALDLGDIMYAPNVLEDKHGRAVLWAWMQEKEHLRLPGSYDSACCLSIPRALYLSPDGKHMMQAPLPELTQLRQQHSAWHSGGSDPSRLLRPGQPLQIEGGGAPLDSSSIDMELEVARGDAESFALIVHPFDSVDGACGAAVVYCWSTNTLQVIYSTDLAVVERTAARPVPPRAHYKQPGPDPAQLAAAEAAAAESGVPVRCGGALRPPGPGASPVLVLRVLLDGSCLEVFTGSGETLSTRIYRGDERPALVPHTCDAAAHTGAASSTDCITAAAGGSVGCQQQWSDGADVMMPAGPNSGVGLQGGHLQLVAFGPGPAQLVSGSCWQMSSMWQQQKQQQQANVTQVITALRTGPGAAAVTAAATEVVMQGLLEAETAAAAAAVVARSAVAPIMIPSSADLVVGTAAAAGLAIHGGAMDAAGAAELQALSPSAAGAGRPVRVEAA